MQGAGLPRYLVWVPKLARVRVLELALAQALALARAAEQVGDGDSQVPAGSLLAKTM